MFIYKETNYQQLFSKESDDKFFLVFRPYLKIQIRFLKNQDIFIYRHTIMFPNNIRYVKFS